METLQKVRQAKVASEETHVERELNSLMEATLRMEHELQMLALSSEEE